MSALYNSALRQSKSIRADLEALNAAPTTTPALQGQLTSSLTSFSRTLDDYQRNIDNELVPDKAEKGKERITNFRTELLEFRSRFAELKHEKEEAQQSTNRTELLGRRPYTSSTPENPYSDAAVASGAGGGGQNVNPLFRTKNANFQPGQGPNSYSTYQSPYGLSHDDQRESQALREQNFLGSSNQILDDYISRGRDVLSNLGDQREMLKGTQRKLYSVAGTLGISTNTIKMVENRAKQDKWIFWGGVVVFIIFVYFVLRYLR
ncbi:hypothetical protein AMS68_006547 [Peltaster fructicola]|uniref:Protein transport protein BOS1 n=1 Tax=Peltaster fructicola TaxID=286661 RepID=A0A6H0Y308_9PEZI|nr:hypothetical protein AMS68_006547 [Peltaster fructicola]